MLKGNHMKTIFKFILALTLLQYELVFAAGQPFSQPNFDALKKSEKSIVVHIHANWCPTCKSQDKVLNPMINSPEFRNVNFLEVNFDTQKDVLSEFNVTTQSTIIVFKNGKEITRSVGDNKKPSIYALVKKAI